VKHKPTSPENRKAYLRAQAQRLLDEAAAWGYEVRILSGPNIVLLREDPHAQETRTGDSDELPQQSRV
jgi:hypothetical protein